MQTLFLKTAALAAMAMVTAVPAVAQEQYINLSLGVVSGSGSVCPRDSGDCHRDTPERDYDLGGEALHLAWGRSGAGSFGDRDELELSIIAADVEGRGLEGVGTANMASFFGATYWDFGQAAAFSPYAGIGGGAVYINGLEGSVPNRDEQQGEQEFRFDKDGVHLALLLHVGIGFEISEGLEIVPALRWQYTLDAVDADEDDSSFAIFSIGPRWRL